MAAARFMIRDILEKAESNEKCSTKIGPVRHRRGGESRPHEKQQQQQCRQVGTDNQRGGPQQDGSTRKVTDLTAAATPLVNESHAAKVDISTKSKTPDSSDVDLNADADSDCSNKKQRKPRTAFSDSQLQSLEKSFERQKYLSVQERMELAAKLQLADAQVKCWFQNRRTKWKRQNSMQYESDLFPALQRMLVPNGNGGMTFPHAGASWPYPNLPSAGLGAHFAGSENMYRNMSATNNRPMGLPQNFLFCPSSYSY